MVFVCNIPYDKEDHFGEYNFPLSDFQKHAIHGILQNDHVLVTAHTGSGKTLPAEFAIQHWVSQGKKVIYTSPIKALSNQKFYEFSNKFPHISFGLFTGDIKTNPEADVIIMTTEILMNRLFNHSEDVATDTMIQFQLDFEKELAAVVFDEIHYINDPDRGQVWEKTILMLPDHVQMIMLSATMDNPKAFAQWIEDNHKNKAVHLCPTNHRVVPLSHYSYMILGEQELKQIKDKPTQQRLRKMSTKPMLLYDSKGKFSVETYNELKFMDTTMKKMYFNVNRKFLLNRLSQYLKDHNMLPAIGFVFSRKQVEMCAKELTTPLLEEDSKLPSIVEREANQIIRRLPNHEEYSRLPEYQQLISLLQKGVGIHHSGMIPILREIVELFISKKYIQFLFATESFAIGLDCPIKTAVFTNITKFDGDHDRLLHSHEYTQMAGRAGRRGIDKVGYVIQCNNLFRRIPTQNEYIGILSGKPPSLLSKFKIDYNLVFSVLKANQFTSSVDQMTEFIQKSLLFNEIEKNIQSEEKQITKLEETIKSTQTKYNDTLTIDQEMVVQYMDLEKQTTKLNGKKRLQALKKLESLEKNEEKLKTFVEKQKQLDMLAIELRKERQNYEYVCNYVKSQVEEIVNLLVQEKLLWKEEDVIKTTTNGELCSHIAEVHSPVWVDCMVNKWDYFKGFTMKQMVGLFSCATDVKVKDEYKCSVPNTEDAFLRERLLEMKEMHEHYEEVEGDRNIRSGIRYDEILSFSIIDEAMEWCDCSNEEECKYFIHSKLVEKGISLGDFTKAIIKIATISKEFRTLYELPQCNTQTEWLYKLSEIEEKVLKYIATNQSLYV